MGTLSLNGTRFSAILLSLAFCLDAKEKSCFADDPTKPRNSKDRTISDAQGNFRFKIPVGFQSAEHIKASNPEYAYVYEQRQHPRMKLFIERLGTKIEKKAVVPSVDSGVNPGVTAFTLPWNGQDIHVVELRETLEEKPFVTFNMQVPLKPEAIQVSLAGPVFRREYFLSTLENFLSGLEGEVEYLESTSASRSEWPHYGKLLLVGAIAIFILGFAALFWVSRRLPAGSVVPISVAIFVIGKACSGPSREALMISGTLQLLGVAAFLLGLIDYFRRRVSK